MEINNNESDELVRKNPSEKRTFKRIAEFFGITRPVKKQVDEEPKHNGFPFEVKFVERTINEQLLKDFTGERTSFVQIGRDNWFFPSKFLTDARHYYNFAVRKCDTWVVTFPRSGTTWTQELVWLIANNLDFDTARTTDLTERFPFLEFSSFIHNDVGQEFLNENKHSPQKSQIIRQMMEPGWKVFADAASPRFLKSHLPFPLLPDNILDVGCKVIYVARDPRAVAVSFYHLNRLFRTQGFQGDFETYLSWFLKDLHPWMPYWTHIKEAWQRRSNPNLLFLFYEDMVKDLPGCIHKVAGFLEKPITEDQMLRLVEHLNIERFRANKMVNMSLLKDLGVILPNEQGFVRNGRINSWRDEFTPELHARMQRWIRDNLHIVDYPYLYNE